MRVTLSAENDGSRGFKIGGENLKERDNIYRDNRGSSRKPAVFLGRQPRNNSAICVIVQNPNMEGAGTNNAGGAPDITTDMRSLNVSQEW